MNAVPGVQIGHGIGCLALRIEGQGSRAGRVLTPDEADSIALDLIRQAAHARALAEQGERNLMTDIDTSNEHLVGIQGGSIVIQNAPRGRIDVDEALRMAAWIVAIADTSADHAQFGRVLAAVEST